VCVAAILQAVVAKLWKLRRDNMTFRVYPQTLIEENKWRAARFGLDGKLIDFGKQVDLPARTLIREMLEWFIDDVVDDLGSRKEVEYAFRILDEGTSADRQLDTYYRTGSLETVVDQLIRETEEGVKSGTPSERRVDTPATARSEGSSDVRGFDLGATRASDVTGELPA
jgi:glutamate---cysteine ligase / carboxylate-amine ligase